MKISNSCLFLTAVVAMLISCSSTKTISFINDDMDLRDYNTYKLITVNTSDENFSVKGMVFFNQLEKAIYENMDKRLFDQSNNPDLIVRYELVSKQRTETSQNSNYYNSYSFYTPSPTIVRNYTQGILLIEFRDRKRKKLVWQGSLDLELPKDEADELIKKAVNEVFTSYPYKAGSYEKVSPN